MAKKKEASSVLTTRKSERIEKLITPDLSPVKKKPEKIEKQTDPSPLRRSDRGKKSVEVLDLPNSKLNKDKTANSPKTSAKHVDEDKKNGRPDQNVVGRKRKSLTALRYKSLFMPARIQIESDKEKQIDGDLSPFADGNNQIFNTSTTRINHDVENQQELDPCDKVRESCKEAGVMENGENNTNVQNSGNMLNSSKFVEFWAPVRLSNVQIEQYCFTLLSNAITLRSSSKTDKIEALRGILISLCKCCNHPYLEDLALQNKIKNGPELEKVIEAGAKASGKLQLLDRILCESKKRHLRVLILYQPTTGSKSGSVPLETILVDYVHMRFGEDSYECVVSGINRSKKQAALSSFNKDMTRFIFFLETRACHPSIRLLSTDIILIYDSDLNPANDLRCLQKILVHSQAENIMILRLYSKSTIEEKIMQLSEQNISVESRSKSRYQTLLMWGASQQFDKLSEFLSQDVDNISSEEYLLNDVMEEFVYLIFNKYKSKDTDHSIITRVENSGKSILLNSEIKTPLSDGDQPHLFWKTLLEIPYPKWKFVSVSTSRQRKRPSYFLNGVEDGGVRTRRNTVNNTIEPAQLKPVTEGETGGENEGVPSHNESQSSSGNETGLHDLLKPTVSELFKVLKLTENVKIIVEMFLEFVLKNYNVSKEHTVTLQAFMISMCWIGSSLAKFKIDRSESFKIAKNHCNFTCKEDEANSVFSKLNSAKEAFLEDPKIQDALKDYVPELKGGEPDNGESHPSESAAVPENHESSNEDVSRKKQEEIEIEYFNREWDVKRLNIENDRQTEESLICVLYNYASRIRSEKLKILDQNFATKVEELERMREIHFKELKERHLAANNKVSLHGPEHEPLVEAQNIPELGPTLSANPIEAETHVDIESTGSPTSEKQMANATMSSEPIVEVPAQRCEDVADIVDSVEMEVGKIDSNQENVTHAVEEGNETHGESGEMGMPVGNGNKDFTDNGTIFLDTSHAVEDHNTTLVHTVTSPASDHSVPIIPEIQNEPLQQVADIVMQDNEDEDVPISLPEFHIYNPQPLGASQHNRITPEEPLSTIEIPNQNASQPDVSMVAPRGFNNHNQVGPRIVNHNTDPLQAEMERLYALKDNVPKFLEETKLRLNSEREKEIAELTAQINLKYEAKNREVEVTWHTRKKEIEINLNKVAMNKVLAEAFKSKCQDLTPGHLAMPQVSQAGLMQQTPPPQPQPQPSLPLPPPSPPLSPPPQPQTRRQPPLQIVHQPSALFSTSPSRPQLPNTTIRPLPPNTTVTPPFTTPIRQPAIVNQITPTTTPSTSRPPLTVNPITPSNTHNRQTPGMQNGLPANNDPAIINNMSTRTLFNIDLIIPSSPAAVNPITSSGSLSRPPLGTNQIASSTMQNRPPTSITPMDMSAANLRVNTDPRYQTSDFRPSVNGETRAPAPHMQPAFASHIRPMVSSEIRAPAPHMRPVASSDMRASVSPEFGTDWRASLHVTSSPLLTSLNSPKNSQLPILPPLPTSPPSSPPPPPPPPPESDTVPPSPPSESDTVPPPLPSEHYIVPSPPPPPPPSESDTVPPPPPSEPYIVPSPPPPPPPPPSEPDIVPPPLPSEPFIVPSPPSPPPETSPPPPTSAAQSHQTSSAINLVDITGSSSPVLVCLSDDD